MDIGVVAQREYLILPIRVVEARVGSLLKMELVSNLQVKMNEILEGI